jgi:hypothetical protein
MLFLVTKLHLRDLDAVKSTNLVNIKLNDLFGAFINKKGAKAPFLICLLIFHRKKRFRKFSLVFCPTSDKAHSFSCAI